MTHFNRMMSERNLRNLLFVIMLSLGAAGCNIEVANPDPVSDGDPIDEGGADFSDDSDGGNIVTGGETGIVEEVIDGDTIDVRIDGIGYRVRYIGVNTPERSEVCYREATNANSEWVSGQTVTLVVDQNNTDPFGRLLRYVYVGDTFVNAALVEDGWAEAAEYPPDTAQAAFFRALEADATNAGRGCHPTGIFDDGSSTR